MWSALLAGITYAKVALALLQIAQSLMAKADKREIETEAYNKAVTDATVALYQRLGRVDLIIAMNAQLTPEERRKIALED